MNKRPRRVATTNPRRRLKDERAQLVCTSHLGSSPSLFSGFGWHHVLLIGKNLLHILLPQINAYDRERPL